MTEFFERMSEQVELEMGEEQAPTRLKSRVYSILMKLEVSSGPLLSLTRIHERGHALCVFEQLVRIAPVTEAVKSLNICRICHARVLGERIEHAPIYWANCPYVDFQKG